MNHDADRLVTQAQLWLQWADEHGVSYDDAGKSFDDVARDYYQTSDAYKLYTDLTDAGQLARVLDSYSRSRKPEAEALQRTSWSIGNISSWDSAVMAGARDIMMRTVAGRTQVAAIHTQFSQAAEMPLAVRRS
mgnify:CR=1 FL=1